MSYVTKGAEEKGPRAKPRAARYGEQLQEAEEDWQRGEDWAGSHRSLLRAQFPQVVLRPEAMRADPMGSGHHPQALRDPGRSPARAVV